MLSNINLNTASEISAPFQALIEAWNERQPRLLAELFSPEGQTFGFDGSTLAGRQQIETHLKSVFDNHQTPSFVFKIRNLRPIDPNCVILAAVAGMLQAGTNRLIAGTNAIQTMVTARRGGSWLIESFQNTPAAFHGRPDEVENLTKELEGQIV